MVINKFFLFLVILCLIYLIAIITWYNYPSSIWGLKYKNTGDLKLKDLNKGPYLFVVDHEDPPHTDIMIMSQEIHNHSNKNQKFNLISKKSNNIYSNLIYFTKYNIIETKGETVKKSLEKIKNNENIVLFFRKEFKGSGIYHILKDTNISIVLVRKNLIKNTSNKKLENNVFKYKGMEYEIEYELIENYPIEKEPEDFMKWVKNNLYN